MESKSKTTAASRKTRVASSHPTFYEMITDAIVAMKERTGSSQYAITKYVEGNQKQLPNNFRKLLLFHLKRLVSSGKLVKVKNSFKLPAGKKTPAAATKEKPKANAKSKAGEVGKKKAVAAVAKAKAQGKAKKPGAAMKAKKVTPMKNVKKPKSVKSPAKKQVVKKAKK